MADLPLANTIHGSLNTESIKELSSSIHLVKKDVGISHADTKLESIY